MPDAPAFGSPSLYVFLAAMVPGAGFLGAMIYVRRLKERGREAIARRFVAGDVLRQETLAQSFGLESKGPAQLRGSGALALTAYELWFSAYVTNREVRIPIDGIESVSLVRSHLGKTQFTDLLHVRFTGPGGTEAIAWRVPEPAAWKARLEGLMRR